jgi:TonB-linked SusC/RagA family outer membrane protein
MASQFRRFLTAVVALAAVPALAAAQGGTVTGTVTDRASNQPIVNAQVFLVGTTRGALTSEQGVYRIANVPPGQVQVRVLRIGYEAATQTADVTAGGTATVNFALAASAVQFDRVVVTATGETQRARERGNSVASINVDSLNLAPIQNFSDVLSSRAPGVTVQTAGGTTGGTSRIRIRGSNSVSLENDPLLIVDGVRVNNAPNSMSIAVGGQEPSRFNDINPEDIENIEIIKGPAASALYGTAAANGVIQITTKRGRSGRARWTAFAEGGEIKEVVSYPSNYAQVGVTTTAAGVPTATRTTNCNLDAQSRNACVPNPDSLVSFNPLETPGVTPFRDGWRQQYGFSVAGGGEQATYYIASDFEKEQGVYDINDLQKINLRANVRGQLRDNLDATVTMGYVTSDLQLPQNDNNLFGAISGFLLGSAFSTFPGNGHALGQTPQDVFNIETVSEVDRFTSGLNSNWQPLAWLSANVTAGIDVVQRFDHETIPPNVIFPFALDDGERTANKHSFTTLTGNANLTGTFALTPEIQSTTSAGVQYTSDETRSTEAFGEGLLAGTRSLQGTSSLFAVDEDNVENVTVGIYGQQQFAWRDRVFLTAALRADDNSAFGQDFGLVYYPAFSASWVISEESFFPQSEIVSNLRLRGAYGESGQRPQFRDAVTFYNPVTVQTDGSELAAITVGGAGNAELKPERSKEVEAGFEAGFWNSRIGLDVTAFWRTTQDALIARRLAPSLGSANTRFENLGEVENRGWEAQLTAAVLNMEQVKFDLTASFSETHNELIELGEGIIPIIFGLGGASQRHQEGYPLGAYFQRPILSFSDIDGDGLISRAGCPGQPTKRGVATQPACEVTLGDTAVYLGSPFPTTEISLTSALTLMRWLKVTALLDYRGGYKQFNSTERFRCSSSFINCQSSFDPNTPLELQARAIASFMGSEAGYIEDASFWRLRELAFTLTAPQQWSQRIGMEGMSLTIAGRNLKTWTDYSGFDPEVNQFGFDNFATADFLTQPLTRVWTARLNFTW